MNLNATPRKDHFSLNVLCSWIGLVVSGLGGLVLAGWFLRNNHLIQIHPSFAPMQFNTALGFLLSGLSLFAATKHRRLIAFIGGALVALIGGLTLIEYIGQVDLGIDQLFMKHYVTTQTSHPGRMAPNTALCFFLSGLLLAVVSFTNRYYALLVLGTVITGLGLIAFFGYVTGLETAYGWGHLTRMAIHTSFSFVWLGIGLSLWGIWETQKIGKISDYWALIGLSITLIVVFLAEWQALKGWEEKRIKDHINLQLENLNKRLDLTLTNQKQIFIRMANRWSFEGGIPRAAWENDATAYLSHDKSLKTIEWVDASFQNRWILPHNEKGTADSKNLYFDDEKVFENLKEHQLLSNKKDDIMVSPTFKLTEGGYGYLVVIPLFTDQSLDGYILAGFSIEDTFSKITKVSDMESNFQIRVFSGGDLLAGKTRPFIGWELRYRVPGELNFGNHLWAIDITLTQKKLKQMQSFLPNMVLFSGLIITGVLVYLFVLYKRDRHRTDQLQREVVKRTLAERSLAESHNNLQMILDATQEGIFGIDDQEKITFANSAACKFAGYTLDELRGRLHHDMIDLRLNSPAFTPGSLKRDAYGKMVRQVGEAKFYGKGKDSITVEYSVNQILDDQDHSTGAVVTFQDITNRKIQEKKLAQHTRDLERSNKELNDFAYVASHDLKAPLRGIMQLAKWIEEEIEDEMSETTREYFDLLTNRTSRLERLLEDLLLYSRVGNKKGDLKEVDVGAMVQELFELLNPPAGFNLICQKNLPIFTTLAVPFEQICRNLINNAIKHHDQAQGTIQFECKPIEEGFEFTVSDDGPGIPENHRERVFQIFQTLKPRDEIEGSGMGLAIVKKILVYQDCHISIASNEPRGTRVTFTWPRAISLGDST